MARRVLEILLKITLYLVDVVTDWINGAEQINRADGFKIGHQKELKASNSSLDMSECPVITMGHTFGMVTIGLCWVPGLVGMVGYKNFQPELPTYIQICLMALRFITWPLYVPFYM